MARSSAMTLLVGMTAVLEPDLDLLPREPRLPADLHHLPLVHVAVPPVVVLQDPVLQLGVALLQVDRRAQRPQAT